MRRKYVTTDIKMSGVVAKTHGLEYAGTDQAEGEEYPELILDGTREQHQAFSTAEGYGWSDAIDNALEG